MTPVKYPEVSGRRFSWAELDQIAKATEARIAEILPDIDLDTWDRAEKWYSTAHNVALGLSEMYSVSLAQSAGIIAALSPRVTWETNIDDARDLLAEGEEWGYAALPANVDKALDIRAGSDPDERLGGRKVRSFYRNILDPWASEDVTLDGWMVTALGLPGGDNAHRYLERAHVYDTIAEAFQIMAAANAVRPHVLQAAIWIHYREVLPRKAGIR